MSSEDKFWGLARTASGAFGLVAFFWLSYAILAVASDYLAAQKVRPADRVNVSDGFPRKR